MSSPNSGGEQSMEEILASIRRIISEDDKPVDPTPSEPELKFGAEPERQSSGIGQSAGPGQSKAPYNSGNASYSAQRAPREAGQPDRTQLNGQRGAGQTASGQSGSAPGNIRPLSALLGENALDVTQQVAAFEDADNQRAPDSQNTGGTTLHDDPFGRARPGRQDQAPAPEAAPLGPSGRSTEPSPFAVFGRNSARNDAASVIAEHSQRAANGRVRDASSPETAFSGRDRSAGDDQGTSALERLRATMPTLRRPAPQEFREDSAPLPPSMRDGAASLGRNSAPVNGTAIGPEHQISHPETAKDIEAPADAAPFGHAEPSSSDAQAFQAALREFETEEAGDEPPRDTGTEAMAKAVAPSAAEFGSDSASALTVVARQENRVATAEKKGEAVQQRDVQAPVTLEETVAEMLRPMLRQWLDDNMPRIVARMMAEEAKDNAAVPTNKRGPQA